MGEPARLPLQGGLGQPTLCFEVRFLRLAGLLALLPIAGVVVLALGTARVVLAGQERRGPLVAVAVAGEVLVPTVVAAEAVFTAPLAGVEEVPMGPPLLLVGAVPLVG